MLKLKQTLRDQLSVFRAASFAEKCRSLSFLCLCLFLLDCSIFGGGHYLHIGPITPRMLLGVAALLFALPELFGHVKKYLRNPVILLTAAFILYLLISAIRGYMAPNNMSVLASDLKGFFWLFLIPVFLAAVDTRRKFNFLLDIIVIGAGIQAIFVLFVNIICVLVPNGIMIFYDWMLTDSQIGFVNIISSTIFRIFMKSCPYMVFACAIALFRQIKRKKISWYYLTIQVLCMNALLFSFTRSVYGCLAVVLLAAIVVACLYYRKHIKRVFAVMILSAVLLVGFVGLQELALGGNYLNYGISRTFNLTPQPSLVVQLSNLILYGKPFNPFPDQTTPGDQDQDLQDQQAALLQTEESDDIRAVTSAQLKQLFLQRPIFGHGLGAVAPSRNGPDEYFYLDVLARMGIVGLILYLLPFLYVGIWILRQKHQLLSAPGIWSAVCGMLGFWAITWFNPWMNAVLGIAAYALYSCIPNLINTKKSNQLEDTQ